MGGSAGALTPGTSHVAAKAFGIFGKRLKARRLGRSNGPWIPGAHRSTTEARAALRVSSRGALAASTHHHRRSVVVGGPRRTLEDSQWKDIKGTGKWHQETRAQDARANRTGPFHNRNGG